MADWIIRSIFGMTPTQAIDAAWPPLLLGVIFGIALVIVGLAAMCLVEDLR